MVVTNQSQQYLKSYLFAPMDLTEMCKFQFDEQIIRAASILEAAMHFRYFIASFVLEFRF